ncbi:hypothetical protein OAO01_00450 [Oligoflexia bacterium]|nr:hypothetical protein [Oligoflexia bacterium]
MCADFAKDELASKGGAQGGFDAFAFVGHGVGEEDGEEAILDNLEWVQASIAQLTGKEMARIIDSDRLCSGLPVFHLTVRNVDDTHSRVVLVCETNMRDQAYQHELLAAAGFNVARVLPNGVQGGLREYIVGDEVGPWAVSDTIEEALLQFLPRHARIYGILSHEICKVNGHHRQSFPIENIVLVLNEEPGGEIHIFDEDYQPVGPRQPRIAGLLELNTLTHSNWWQSDARALLEGIETEFFAFDRTLKATAPNLGKILCAAEADPGSGFTANDTGNVLSLIEEDPMECLLSIYGNVAEAWRTHERGVDAGHLEARIQYHRAG